MTHSDDRKREASCPVCDSCADLGYCVALNDARSQLDAERDRNAALTSALRSIIAVQHDGRKVDAIARTALASSGSPTPDRPWLRCPSTHCERRGECASPSDCMVKSPDRPAPASAMDVLPEPQQEWHSSEEDGGPDVGILFKVDDKRSVWCGEVSKKTLVEADADHLGDDFGFFIVLYDETKPQGQQTELLAKAADQERGNKLARLAAIGVAIDASRSKTEPAPSDAQETI
jgi:hypothetical protein